MINQDFEALVSLLEQEEAIYCEMGVLLEEERKALCAMALTRLGEIASRKETLALRVKALDESRKILSRRLGSGLGLTPERITIGGLAEFAPPVVAGRLAEAGRRLRQTVERCQSINDYNALAARKGMELAAGAIEYLIEQADPAGKLYQPGRAKSAYGPTQRRLGPGGPGFISRQA